MPKQPRLLLHTCCGPCSTLVARHFREVGHEVVGYFYNPNIHPYSEYAKRLEAAQQWAVQAEVELLVDSEYGLRQWFTAVGDNLDQRCSQCYYVRLTQVAKRAGELGFPAFSTTLLISPYQQHAAIREAGETVAERTGISFIYQDFRPFFKETYQLSRDYNLYRQNYCGCIFSEYERSQRKTPKK